MVPRLSLGLDLLLQGKPSSTADLLSQRLKALEALSRGAHWTVARQLELCRADQGGIAEESEALDAAKQAREEEKLRTMTNRAPGYKGGDASGGGGKGKRGKDTKGSQKGKGEEGGKGKQDGKREDKGDSWQKKK